MKNMHQAIYELLKDKKRGYLLDAACGKGELGGALEKAGHQVFIWINMTSLRIRGIL